MIPVYQTEFYGGYEEGKERGNCWQAALASVLELPLEAVPHFVAIDENHGGPNWLHYTINWLWYRGYQYQSMYRHLYTNEYYLVMGESPRGNFHHVVVYKNGKMVHDPHPDGGGVLTQDHMDVIRLRD